MSNKLPGTDLDTYYYVHELKRPGVVPRSMKWKAHNVHTDIHIIVNTDNGNYLGWNRNTEMYNFKVKNNWIGYAIVFNSLESAQQCIQENVTAYQGDEGLFIPVNLRARQKEESDQEEAKAIEKKKGKGWKKALQAGPTMTQ